MLLETVMIVLAVAAAAADPPGSGRGALSVVTTPGGLAQAGVVASICQLCLYFADLYDLRVVADRRELFVRLLRIAGRHLDHPGRRLLLVPGR